MEKRLVLALVLCFAVVFLTPVLFPGKEKPEPEIPPAGGTVEEPAGGTATGAGAEGTTTTGTEGEGEAETLPPPEVLPEHPVQDDIRFERPNFVADFTTRGGALRRAWLTNYERMPGQTPEGPGSWYRVLREEMRQPGSIRTRRSELTGAVKILPAEDGPEARAPKASMTAPWELVEANQEEGRLVFRLLLPSGLELKKTWTFPSEPDRYDVRLEVDVKNVSAKPETVGRTMRLSVNGPVGLVPDDGDGSRVVESLILGYFGKAGDMEEFASGQARHWESPENGVLDRGWVGMGNLFFVSALVADAKTPAVGASLVPVLIRERIERLEEELGRPLTPIEFGVLGVVQARSCLSCGGRPPKSEAQGALEKELGRALSDEEYARLGKSSLSSALRTRFEVPEANTTVRAFSGMLFLGPKAKPVLGEERYQVLAGTRRTGWKWISEPLLWILRQFYALVGNYGVAIILLTLLVRGVMFPLSRHQQMSMQKYSREMQRLKPKMDDLRKKFKDNPRKMNEELMKLYKREGVSVVPKGCLVMFLQIPIFIALFQGLRAAIELRHASFLWVNDLTGPDRLAHLPFLKNVPLLPEWLNLLPILMTVTWYLSARLQPAPVEPAFAKASAGASLLRRPAILSASLFRPPSVWPAEACAP
jgi:YidC/Oxa1 family membrane protein insertase